MSENFKLPQNLQTATQEEWRKLVEKTLGGASFGNQLNTKTYDGIEIKPLYTNEALQTAADASRFRKSSVSGEQNRPFEIIQLIDIPSVSLSHKQIVRDLEGGASGLALSIGSAIPYGCADIPINNNKDYETLFNGVNLTGKSIYFSNDVEGLVNAANFLNFIEENNINANEVGGSFCFDPISTFAAQGAIPEPMDEALSNWLDASHAIANSTINMSSFMASGRTWQQAGSSEATELAHTLSAALYYWRALEASGLPHQEALSQIDLSLTATSDLFLTAAKFRAMRALWAKVTTEAGVEQTPTKIIAEMSYLGLTKNDPEVNMLRATSATMAAGIGNVDALVLLPYSSAHGVATSAARRLALNTQIIAMEESHIGRVEDPGSGSWYIESLTQELAKKAWAIFQQTEKKGGLLKQLKTGEINFDLETMRNRQLEDITNAKREITGVTSFPNLAEKAPDLIDDIEEEELASIEILEMSVPELDAPAKGSRFEDIKRHLKDGMPTYILDEALQGPALIKPMLASTERRLVEDVEFLRNLSDELLELNDKRPSVFLANLGQASDFTARATWARSYFETGGIEAITNDGFEAMNELGEAFAQSGSVIACICSSNDRYGTHAVEAAKTLLSAGAEAIYIVARPSFLKTIDYNDRHLFQTLLYQGTDMLSTLVDAHQIINFADETMTV